MRRIATLLRGQLVTSTNRKAIGPHHRQSRFALAVAMAACLRAAARTISCHNSGQSAVCGKRIAQKQGTTHVCPGTQVQLAWRVKGKASLSAASGQMYQEPLCSTVHRVPAKGQELVQSNSQIASSCGNEAIFRLTASKDFWRWSGSCPGTGCPAADHELVLEPQSGRQIGGKPASCPGNALEVNALMPVVDWDDHVRIGTISVTGSTKQALSDSARTLTVSHDGKRASFFGSFTSDAFRGEKMSGTWILRLSGCDSPPAVLAIVAETSCSQ
jgi:hypothetical protein